MPCKQRMRKEKGELGGRKRDRFTRPFIWSRISGWGRCVWIHTLPASFALFAAFATILNYEILIHCSAYTFGSPS
jgi:hypothetical protein